MSGTVIGGYKAAKTNKERHGKGFYITIGAMGGKKSRGGGWTGRPDLARLAGAKGGAKGKRGPKVTEPVENMNYADTGVPVLGYVVDHIMEPKE